MYVCMLTTAQCQSLRLLPVDLRSTYNKQVFITTNSISSKKYAEWLLKIMNLKISDVTEVITLVGLCSATTDHHCHQISGCFYLFTYVIKNESIIIIFGFYKDPKMPSKSWTSDL